MSVVHGILGAMGGEPLKDLGACPACGSVNLVATWWGLREFPLWYELQPTCTLVGAWWVTTTAPVKAAATTGPRRPTSSSSHDDPRRQRSWT